VKYLMRMTETQRATLRLHLFPGDGLEAVALLLCGRLNGAERHVFTVRKVVTVPHDVCDRRSDRITWPTDFVDTLLKETHGKGHAIVKVHSHSTDYRRFSSIDDESDSKLFSSVASLLDDDLPHASVIMLPDDHMIGRVLGRDGKIIAPITSIMAVGHEIRLWAESWSPTPNEFMRRHAQLFGRGTTEMVRGLSIAVVGCSGTGSIVIEQLARLGVGRILLVDPDLVEEKNLNRILNAGKEDAYLKRPKVHVLASAIARMGLGQEVIPIHENLISAEVIKSVAECDIVFGCMDGVEGRHMLNRLATFYVMPYFDVGVRLDADGKGGIDQIAGATHYLQPGGSSLFSRGCYDMNRLNAEEIRRTNPELYRRRVQEGYLRGVDDDRPAVISVNMFFGALIVNDFLARLHPYRNQPNSDFSCIRASLSEMQLYPEADDAPCQLLERHVGRGDVTPLLDRASLS
jgi:hypothetical protein